MRRLVILALFACAACSEREPSEAEQESLDQAAVAAVEAANDAAPPLEEVVPDALLLPDIERNDIYGASCSYAPGTSLGARVIARQADAFMKIDGEVVRFAADPGARELELGTRSLYNGREYSLQLDLSGEGEPAGEETMNYEGTVNLRDRWDRIIYTGTGTVQCGV